MPEAPIDEYHTAQPWEYQIWLSGQVGLVQPESEAHAMDQAAHGQLRQGILSLDPSHDPTAPFG
jgi:hypothetical protein